MSRSSFGQPPQPQVGMGGPKGLPSPMSAPKMAPQGGIAPPPQMPQGGGIAPPSMFRRPRY